MKILNYQQPINWRQVHFSLTHPTIPPEVLLQIKRNIPSDLSLFLPADCILDAREVRDWLHDKAHTGGHYDLFGFYRTEQTEYLFRTIFRGIIVVFRRAIDAVHFRLSWNTTLILEAA